MNPEKLLPESESMNAYFNDYFPQIEDEINEIREKYADFVDIDYEFYSLATLINFASTAQKLVDVVYDYGTNDAFKTVYRSLFFAMQSAEVVVGKSVSADFPELVRYGSLENPYDSITSDVNDYLCDNPAIDAFMSYFVDEIDEDRGLQHLAETTMGAVFMLIERNQAERYLHNKINAVKMEDFE